MSTPGPLQVATLSRVGGEAGDLGGKAGASALALRGLGDRLPRGLGAGDAACAGDVLQGSAALVAEAERERL